MGRPLSVNRVPSAANALMPNRDGPLVAVGLAIAVAETAALRTWSRGRKLIPELHVGPQVQFADHLLPTARGRSRHGRSPRRAPIPLLDRELQSGVTGLPSVLDSRARTLARFVLQVR